MEFLLVMIPLLAIAGSTLGITWYAFERVALRVLASEAGWRFAQPDFDHIDLQGFLAARLESELGMNRFSIETEKDSQLNHLTLLVDQLLLPGGLGISTPELRVETHAVLEN